MIFNASSQPLQPSTLPDMQDALTNWFQNITATKIVKATVNFKLVETRTDFSFMGVRQPYTAQQLAMKPEGQRAWKWETIHCYPSLILTVDDVIEFNGVKYRVMQKLDYKEYGYIEYHVVQDYQ